MEFLFFSTLNVFRCRERAMPSEWEDKRAWIKGDGEENDKINIEDVIKRIHHRVDMLDYSSLVSFAVAHHRHRHCPSKLAKKSSYGLMVLCHL